MKPAFELTERPDSVDWEQVRQWEEPLVDELLEGLKAIYEKSLIRWEKFIESKRPNRRKAE